MKLVLTPKEVAEIVTMQMIYSGRLFYDNWKNKVQVEFIIKDGKIDSIELEQLPVL